MLCRFCRINPPSLNAHIIPQSFFVEHADKRYPSQQITDLENVFPKSRPIGVYDSGILCEACEREFSTADDYGYRFFHPSVDYSLCTDGQGTCAYRIEKVDYDKLKRFLLSVLWRASVSTQEFYAGVDLGPYEEKIRKLLQNGEVGPPDDYSIYIERFDYPSSLIPILCPTLVRDDVNMYMFVLNGYLVHIKVDNRLLPSELRGLMLCPNAPLQIPQVPYRGSQEYELMQKVRRDAYKRA